MIKFIYKILKNKKKKKSYSTKLIKSNQLYKKKIIEESFEYVLEFKKKNKKRIISEFCDLFFHSIIPLIKFNISYKKIKKELKKRSNKK
ncbi:phosphoribosyl-ATP diphosphatase [Candidatus Vidania fulgoroideorum]